MVDTMQMAVTSLVAPVRHYYECYDFRLQYRRQYDRVMDLGREPRVIYDDNTNGNPNNPHALTVGEGMARVLRRVAENVKGVLDADPTFTEAADDVVVCARVKEPYSLWRKILKTGATRLLDVPDALALRVVLNAKKESPDEPDDVTAARERALCYYVQSLCTTHWEPDLNKEGGRFKDYIDSPKPNGYQSLHYTASTWWGGVDWPLEIQVRTGEMHKIAEYGLAAHFDYKENAKRGGYAGESDPPVYRTYAGSRASAGLHGGDYPASASQPTRLNDETYLQAVQEWHWNQIDGTAYSSSPSYQQRRFEEVQGELNSKIGTGYSPDHNEDRAQRVRARAERIAPYIESFTAAQSDLARNHVFVFLASSEQNPDNGAGPSGTIVSLPSGSCILDALREGAKHFPGVDSNCFQGKAHFGVQRNGMAASSVTEMLKNGDVITLPTVCNAGEVLTP
jgi:ppGpp synthetase/RelA/SpoT-type nucleotidyltranferase